MAKRTTISKAQPETESLATSRGYMKEHGVTGLKHFSGMVNEEFLKELQGEKGIRLYTEMRENHPIIGGFMHAIEMMTRGVKWSIEAASQAPEDVKAADLVSSCLDDMEQTWQDTVSEILSFLVYGFSYHEICYKVRRGPDQTDPSYRSRYNDNRIGWSKIAIRSQDSLYKWQFDRDGSLLGMYQHVYEGDAGAGGYERYIPKDKALLFKARSYKNNPQGRSILRNAVVPFLAQRKIEEIERIGIERDLAGFPIIYAPGKIMGPKADAAEKQTFMDLVTTVRDVRRDSAEGLVLPSDVYKDTNVQQYRVELLSTGGARQFDTNAIVTRYDQRIAMVVLADFLMLGHAGVGSFAMTESKTDLFAVSLLAFLDVIGETFTRDAIPVLLKLNGLTPKETPRLTHAGFDQRDLEALGNYVQSLAQAGMPLFPDPALEQHLRDVADLPEPSLDMGREVGEGSGSDVGTAPNDQQRTKPQLQGKQPMNTEQDEEA